MSTPRTMLRATRHCLNQVSRSAVAVRVPSSVLCVRASFKKPSNSGFIAIRAPFSTGRTCQAESTPGASSLDDPQMVAAQQALDEGTLALEQGDFEKAQEMYQKSLDVKETAIACYNLGVVQYQRQQLAAAIQSFEKSIALTPPDVKPSPIPEDPNAPLEPLTPAQVILADTHTNLGAAYILSQPPRADKALEHLQIALNLSPEDGEVCYNLAAVLEATGEEEEALVAFQRAEKLGIERAAVNIRNIGGKLVGKMRKEEEEKLKSASEAASADKEKAE